VIGLRGTETESVIGSRGRKKTTDVLRRSAEARSLEKLGANTTRSRAARVTGRRKTGRREVRNKKCETKVPIILGELEAPKRGINSRPERRPDAASPFDVPNNCLVHRKESNKAWMYSLAP